MHTSSKPQNLTFTLNRLKANFTFSFICFLFVFLFIQTNANAETQPLKDTEFLGLKLIDADIGKVRAHLWNIGGFLQGSTTIKQRHTDKFFTWSTIRDSYYVLFTYNHAGNLVSVKRLYRPYSTEHHNSRATLSTKDVAKKMIERLGQPSFVKRKGWGGGPSYLSFTWQDDDMEITIDREGSEYLGNVFVTYKLKNNQRYEVIYDKDDNA